MTSEVLRHFIYSQLSSLYRAERKEKDQGPKVRESVCLPLAACSFWDALRALCGLFMAAQSDTQSSVVPRILVRP